MRKTPPFSLKYQHDIWPGRLDWTPPESFLWEVLHPGRLQEGLDGELPQLVLSLLLVKAGQDGAGGGDQLARQRPQRELIGTVLARHLLTAELGSLGVSVDEEEEVLDIERVVVVLLLPPVLSTAGNLGLPSASLVLRTDWLLQAVLDPGGHKEAVWGVGVTHLLRVPADTGVVNTQPGVLPSTSTWPALRGLQSGLAEPLEPVWLQVGEVEEEVAQQAGHHTQEGEVVEVDQPPVLYGDVRDGPVGREYEQHHDNSQAAADITHMTCWISPNLSPCHPDLDRERRREKLKIKSLSSSQTLALWGNLHKLETFSSSVN